MTLRETAAALGVSHGLIVVLERRAIGKLLLGLGLYSYEQLPRRIRKFLSRSQARAYLDGRL